MKTENAWKVTETDSHCFTIVDPTERWKMRVKWDGCIDITHAYNGCLDEAEERDLVYLHICSLPELLVRLKAAAELISTETKDKRYTFWMANDDSNEALNLFKH